VSQRSEEEPIEFRAEEWSVARRDEHSVAPRDIESPAKAFDGSSAGLTIDDERGLGDNRPEDRDDRGNRHGYDNLSGQRSDRIDNAANHGLASDVDERFRLTEPLRFSARQHERCVHGEKYRIDF